MFKRLDRYIIGKFLGTFFFSIVLIISIAVVFDLTEKMDDFYESQVSTKEIIVDYYFNFVPYYTNMFTPLFIFISVIFFTSKLAGDSEIIATLAAGVSFHRLMWPYLFSATLLFAFSFWLGGYIIPTANEGLLNFENQYIKKFKAESTRNVQMQVEPGTVLYIESFQMRTKSGYRASLDHFEGKRLASRLTAERIKYDSAHNWTLERYTLRTFEGLRETVETGKQLDTIIPILPEDLFITAEEAQMMTNPELRAYMNQQRERGAGNLQAFEVEWWKRFASPIGAFIMTLLGVTLSSRKIRGGMGKNLGVGIALSAIYILFSTVSTSFSVNGVMSPFMAVWLPNFIFLAIGIFLYTRAPK